MRHGHFTLCTRLAFIAGCVITCLALQVIPIGVVLETLGICIVIGLLVVDFPNIRRALLRRLPNHPR